METKSHSCQPFQEDRAYPHLVDGPIKNQDLSNIKGGALIEFKGIIRADLVNGQEVSHIDYEVYFPVAEDILNKIEQESLEFFNLLECKIFHSFGRVKTGECSLLVQVVSKHRVEGFEACSKIVDRIKVEAPVWKQEFYKNQSYHWVKGN